MLKALYRYARMHIHEYLSQLPNQQPAEVEALLMKWKHEGFYPRVIYDIGSCVLHWSQIAHRVWPEAIIICFDAFEQVEFLYQKSGYPYYIGVLSDVDGKEVRFYENEWFPGGNSYYREVGHPSNLFPAERYRICTTKTLDSVVADRRFPYPDLVKIDVQGCERDVLQGGWNTIAHSQRLIVEMQHTNYNDGAPQVHETLPWILSHGWRCIAHRFANTSVDADYAFERLQYHESNSSVHSL